MTVGSLFSGIGGLEMGISLAEPDAIVEWQAERDPHALAVLEHHWPTVRRYTDVRDIDATATRVDVVCGGFPCQPHSLAGKRKGTSDERWIWPEFARIVGALRPSVVFIENVPGLRTSGLRDVLVDLAGLGFDAEWDLFSAEETGAPHRRIRLFVFAYTNSVGGWIQQGRRGGTDRPDSAVIAHDGSHGPVADADGSRELQQEWLVSDERRWVGDGGEALANSDSIGERKPDDKAATERDRRQGPRSNASRVGWWATEPDVGRVAHGVPGRSHRLRLLGNAVVPQQAALAWVTLLARARSAKGAT